MGSYEENKSSFPTRRGDLPGAKNWIRHSHRLVAAGPRTWIEMEGVTYHDTDVVSDFGFVSMSDADGPDELGTERSVPRRLQKTEKE